MSDTALFAAVFLACIVEAVEALTIVLAAGTARDWRSALTGVLAGVVTLAVVIAALGPAISAIPIGALRLFVGGVERDRLLDAHHRRQRVLQPLDAPVRYRHRVPQAGGAQPLAREKVVGDGAAGDLVLVLEQQPGLLEHALLAGCIHVHQHVAGRQDGGETVHGRGSPRGWLVARPAATVCCESRRMIAPGSGPLLRPGHRGAGLRHCSHQYSG